MDLKKYLTNKNGKSKDGAYWERCIFQLLGLVLAIGVLQPVTRHCWDNATATGSSGGHAILWFGLGLLLLLLSLFGGQLLGAAVYEWWFANVFAEHNLDGLQIFRAIARIGGSFVVLYCAWYMILGWHNMGMRELGLGTMALAMGVSVTGFGMVSMSFNILLFAFSVVCLAVSKDLYFVLTAWVCLAMVAVSYCSSHIGKSVTQQRES